MSCVKKNKSFIALMMKHKKSPGEIKRLLEIADRGEIEACCEIYLNALKGNIPLNSRVSALLQKHHKHCQELVNKKTGLSKKRKILKHQSGGFFPALLGLAAPILAPVVEAIIGGIIRK